MKTILSRLKTLITNNMTPVETATLGYVKHVEIAHPDMGQTVISIATLPTILFVPESTSESWQASQEKEAVNNVMAYLILRYHQREASIMGDTSRPSGQGKGITDLVADFLSVVRGHRLAVDGSNYLDKPLDILNVDYIVETLGENANILIAQISMQCTRLFLQATLPGNI